MAAVTLQSSVRLPLSERTGFLLETLFSSAFAPCGHPPGDALLFGLCSMWTSSWRRSSLRPLLHVDILHPAQSSTSGCSWFQTPQDTMLARHPLQPQPGGAWRTAWWRTWPEGLPWAPSQGFTGSAFSRGRWKALFFISTAVPNLAGTRDWFRGRQLFHGWCGQGMVSG